MSLWAKHVTLATPTASGTQSFTVSGVGTPKLAFFIPHVGTSGNFKANNAGIGFGATDGTNQYSTYCHSTDATGNAQTASYASNNKCVVFCTDAGVLAMSAVFSQWVTDGVEVTWTFVSGANRRVTCILMGGTDLSCLVGSVTTPATVDTATDVTAPGFQPDHVIGFGRKGQAFDNTGIDDSDFSIGVAARGGGQGSMNLQSNDGAGVCQKLGVYSALYIHKDYASSPYEAVEIADFDSSGFSAYTRVSGVAQTIAYVALKYNGASYSVTHHTTPNQITPYQETITSPGFQPQWCMAIAGCFTAAESVSSTDSANSICIGMASSSSDHYIVAIDDDDGPSTMNCSTASGADFVYVEETKDVVKLEAVFNSFGASGPILDWTTLDQTTQRKWILMAIGAAPAAAVGQPTMRRWGGIPGVPALTGRGSW